MSSLLAYFILVLFCAAGAGFALWKGGPAERYAALAVVGNLAIGLVGTWLFPESEAFIRLCNDGLAALALLAITVRYGALWMGVVMLFYAAQFSLHSYYMVTDRAPNDYFHALVNNTDFMGVILSLIAGTAVAWRRRAVAARDLRQAAP